MKLLACNLVHPYDATKFCIPEVKPWWWDEKAYCKLHNGIGHDIENCGRFKHIVQDLIENGKLEIDAQTLMRQADSFYKTAMDRQTWEQTSTEDKKVLALTAKITKMIKNREHTKSNTGKRKDHPTKEDRNFRRTRTKVTNTEKEPKPNWLAKHEKPSNNEFRKTKE